MSDVAALGIPGAPVDHIYIPERNALIHSDYLMSPHRDMKLKVYEAAGVPFIVNGIHVEVGMIPPERREYVGPDGVIVSRDRFKHLYLKNYEAFYAFKARGSKDVQLDDPLRAHIPAPKAYLSETVDENGRYRTIGYDPMKPRPRLVVARRGDEEPVGTAAEMAAAGFRPKPVDAEEELARLRAENEALRVAASGNALADAVNAITPEKPARSARKITAPCGKELGGGLHFHKKKCAECQSIEAGTPEEAA